MNSNLSGDIEIRPMQQDILSMILLSGLITTIKWNCYFTTTVDLDHIVDMRRHTDMAFIPK